jgi:hypothetical protein
MSNIKDYLNWRGDLSFSQDPINDVDALVFALISYLPYKQIIPGIESNLDISILETCNQYFSQKSKTQKATTNINPSASASFDSELEDLLYLAANSPRFKTVRLSKYEENTDFIIGRQFGALTFTLKRPEHIKVIAFRGTDNSLIGWKEDFQLAYLAQTPAQESAREYLNKSVGLFSEKVFICGHSKGGNLALYAGSNINPLYQRKIKRILNFDGPGFDFSVNNRTLFAQNEGKVINYLPEKSTVGMLLEPVGNRCFVSSSAQLIDQHNAFNWNIEKTEFVPGKLSNTAITIDQILKSWLTEVSLSERETFIDALFDVLGASEGKVIPSSATEGIKEINKILIKYSDLDSQTKSLLTQLFISLTSQFASQTKINITTAMKVMLPEKKQ